MKHYEFWFVVGSQSLYGPEVLETVARRAQEMPIAIPILGCGKEHEEAQDHHIGGEENVQRL